MAATDRRGVFYNDVTFIFDDGVNTLNIGNGLPVPPWSVNYATGEVVGRTYPLDGSSPNPPPLTLENIQAAANAITNTPDGLLHLEADDDGAAGSTILGEHAEITAGAGATVDARKTEITTGDTPTVTGETLTVIAGSTATIDGYLVTVTADDGTVTALRASVSVTTGVAVAADLTAASGDGDGSYFALVAHSPAKFLDYIYTSLPTSDPGITGVLWNDGGSLAISGSARILDGGAA